MDPFLYPDDGIEYSGGGMDEDLYPPPPYP
jgi:hypothetical protein